MTTPREARRTSILLADDDERFRTLVRNVLEEDGFDVVAEAGDAQTTRALAREHDPDVVVIDLVMAGSDGLSTARELMEDEPERPVLVISTLFDPVIEQEAVAMGAWYLEKAEGAEALGHTLSGIASVTSRER